MAPLLATLLQGGFSLLAGAVATKGKEFVEEKTGVKLDNLLGSEEGRIRLKQIEAEHEQFLAELADRADARELDYERLAVENTKSARDMNTRIQESLAASDLAKNAAYYIDFGVIAATVLLAALLFWVTIPVTNKELLYTALGALLAHCGTILNFHRGTSASSRAKDDTITKLTGGGQ